ncbi:phenylacetate--CoA ligase family protein [Anaerolentibacter hominis]|uniref:phenylacetate--CoA ligase family protein n=1 Tax=Anaerolentibacter hominis TaxID=3079009 RepID=UPI0031B82A73
MNNLNLLKELTKLKKNEKMTREQMVRLQNQKLRQLLRHAWQNSPYYRQAFEQAGITEDNLDVLPLSAFPTIDKALLMERFDELITATDLKQEELLRFDSAGYTDNKPYRGEYHVVHSSGSTGKPCYFIYDNAAWDQMLLGIIRGALWNMSIPQILKLLISKPRIIYIAATDGRYGGAMAVGDGIDGIGASQMYLDINTPLAQWKKSIQEFKPNIIIGYPSAIKILAELKEKGEVSVQSARIISCGEPLSPGLRSYLENTFSCPVINIYGASESLALGVESGCEDGILLFDDLNVIEVINGTMYLTCLYNYVQPLIRYKISDHLVLKEPCGDTPFTKTEILLGRDEDMLWFEDGSGNRDFLHPLAVEGFCIEGLRDYQFRQVGPDAFEMHAEVPDQEHQPLVRSEMLRQMKTILQEKKLEYVQFYVRFVDAVYPDPKTGKNR